MFEVHLSDHYSFVAFLLHFNVKIIHIELCWFLLVLNDLLNGSHTFQLNATRLGVDRGDLFNSMRGRSATHFEFDRL